MEADLVVLLGPSLDEAMADPDDVSVLETLSSPKARRMAKAREARTARDMKAPR